MEQAFKDLPNDKVKVSILVMEWFKGAIKSIWGDRPTNVNKPATFENQRIGKVWEGFEIPLSLVLCMMVLKNERNEIYGYHRRLSGQKHLL